MTTTSRPAWGIVCAPVAPVERRCADVRQSWPKIESTFVTVAMIGPRRRSDGPPSSGAPRSQSPLIREARRSSGFSLHCRPLHIECARPEDPCQAVAAPETP
jgi:hypothetical protein